MNLFDIFPNVLNPIIVSRLDSNVEAAILSVCLNRWANESADEDGWIHFTRKQLCELTGLTENKIKVSERFLKNRDIIKTKISNGARFYKVDFTKVQDVSGYRLKPTFLEKLDNNAKATLLFVFYLEFNQDNRVELCEKIPSKQIELATGMDKNSQIYARDSLLGMNYLRCVSKKDLLYKLNIDKLVENNLVKISD